MPTRDRISELRRVPASELRANPKNWRTHPRFQAEALRKILDQVGYADVALARETPEGLELIDGHLRKDLADETPIPVLILDVDEAEADLLLATLDPITALAGTNEEALLELLASVQLPDEALAEALAGLKDSADPFDEWDGMPEYEQEDLHGIRVTVHFKTEEDATDFFTRIERPRRRAFWWPDDEGIIRSDSSVAFIDAGGA